MVRSNGKFVIGLKSKRQEVQEMIKKEGLNPEFFQWKKNEVPTKPEIKINIKVTLESDMVGYCPTYFEMLRN